MLTHQDKSHKLQMLAIFLLIFADGCDVGQFSLSSFDTWNFSGILSIFFHALAGFIIMAAGIKIFYLPKQLAARIWISVISVISIIGNIVMIILGMTNPDPNSVGVHSPGDWAVVVAISIGVLLWFISLLREAKESN